MFYLKRNLPGWERLVRLGLGLACVAASHQLMPAGAMQWGGYICAGMLALTGVAGFCPACALVGRKLADSAK